VAEGEGLRVVVHGSWNNIYRRVEWLSDERRSGDGRDETGT
jgi:hypothetical protein